ncbi:extracellular solute-binding protein [Paenibacillus barcinonensis]|uniref:Extracellular solute-binding protein n=1 Tax=Paenibacillus barcinonensis TaxID=198119 RepID=A0A2V4VAH7_PAEBA|nr:ABC transporter substrate-binding protein [Paenibacillus barcinonensis]PYE45856.1 putative aldouronate transport system substrate-binding protein [Paenibacillus barcinonensis]QKS57128.1 extracellular solute-binding protein [Paenibacillus barcinonensis]
MASSKVKIALASVLAFAMLAGCDRGNGHEASFINTDGASSALTLEFFSVDPSPNWNGMKDDVGKVITAKTGITLNGEFAVSGGQDKISLMAASRDFPDIVSPKGELSKLVDAGAMVDLTDLIEQHAPNLKKLYGNFMNRLKYSNDDQAIYVLPTYYAVNQTYFDAGGGFGIQHRVLKELGYPQVHTLQDYEHVLRAYREKHPMMDGQPTIPLTLDAEGWRIMITVTNPAFLATGAPDDGEYYIHPETYEAMLHYKRPEEKEYFRWLNHMYNEGLLDPESFVQKSDQYKSKIASGRVLGIIDQDWGYAEAENELKSAGKAEAAYSHFPVTLSEEMRDHSFQNPGFVSGWGVGITTANPDPVKTIKLFDYLASEEGQILINWGIEGKHYEIRQGKRVIPAAIQDQKTNHASMFQKESGIGLYKNMSGRYGDGVKDSTDNYVTTNFPEQIEAGYTDSEKETLQAYGASTWKDLFPSEEQFPVKPWGAAYNMPAPSDSEYMVIYQKTQDIIRKRIPEAVLSSPEQFDVIFDGMLTELNQAGARKMEKQYTELIRNRVRLWNEKPG